MGHLVDIKNKHLMIRSYELLDFIKKFLRPIEDAINSLGVAFVSEQCLERSNRARLKLA